MRIKPAAVVGIAMLATLCALLLAAASAGAAIPNTGAGPEPEAGFGHVEGAPNVLTDRLLDQPFNPGDPDAAEAAAAAALWSPGTPESDLAGALDAMAGAGDASEADGARRLALDILEGN